MKKYLILFVCLLVLVSTIFLELFPKRTDQLTEIEKQEPLVIEIIFANEDEQIIRQFAGSLIIKNNAADSKLLTPDEQLELYRTKHNIPKNQPLETILPTALYVCWDNNQQTKKIYDEIKDRSIIELIKIRPLEETDLGLNCAQNKTQ